MRKILMLLITAFAFSLNAQRVSTFWVSVSETDLRSVGERVIIPKKYKVFQLIAANLKNALFSTPVVIELPMPDGSLQKFRVDESPMMAPELAAQFPDIKTFNVTGIDEPTASGKLDWTSFGFHGMIRSVSGDIFIDPYSRNDLINYITYYAADFEKDASKKIPEASGGKIAVKKKEGVSPKTMAMICTGTNLRTYRLAVACTHEYAIAATGLATPTVAQTLACVVTTVNRVDGVYETEVAVKMVLIAGTTACLFPSATGDPFTGNNNANTLINESQTVIDSKVGDANYDQGHTFSTGGGGLSSLGVICVSGSKASSITGSPSPVGDPYDIDYVAHEMGHEYGSNHPFTANTGSCSGNANPPTEVEPGSGVTIMAYAGICGSNDLAPHSIPYFHTISFDEITDYTINQSGNSCPVTTTTTNHPPVVTGSATYTVPLSTPFTLTGSATDPDGDALTYSWEETDLGQDNNWNSGQAPYFRSYVPVTSPSRTFPKLSMILLGPQTYTATLGEYVPATAQTLNFRLSARDNKMGGGGVCYAASQVIVANSGPFAITAPNTSGITWASGSTQTVTWNVKGTNASPVSCANVNIVLSTDGGQTFTSVLLANTPNSGSQTITVPNETKTITTCRIRVECANNIFFDINDKNFTISAAVTGIATLNYPGNSGISLFPNPAEDQVRVILSGLVKNEKSILKMYDLLGHVVFTEVITGREFSDSNYDLSQFSKGVYFVEISNSSQRSVARLIKQ